MGTVRQHLRPQVTDRGPADGPAARRVGHHRVLLVERGDAVRVTGVGPLDEQAGDVLGPHGLLVVLMAVLLQRVRGSSDVSTVIRRTPEVQQMVFYIL